MAITIFGYFVTVERIDSTESTIHQRSELLVRHFSSIIELGVVAQDMVVLSSYADIMLKEKDVVSVLIKDVDNNVLIEEEIEDANIFLHLFTFLALRSVILKMNNNIQMSL
ncbi:hypothetical protein ACFL3P_05400 [Pseudomonadota bacterium]